VNSRRSLQRDASSKKEFFSRRNRISPSLERNTTQSALSRLALHRKSSLKAKLAAHSKRENDLTTEIAVLRSELDKIRNEENKLLVNKTAVVENQALEISRLDSMLKQTLEELKLARENVRNKGEHDGVLVAEISILKRQVNEKNKKLEEMKEEMKHKSTEIEGLKKRGLLEARRLEASANEVSSQSISFSQENQKLKEQLLRAKKVHEETENKMFELQAEYSLQAAQLKSLKEKLELQKNQVSLTVQLEETQAKNSELRLKLIESEKDRQLLKERADQTTVGTHDWERKLAEKERSLNTNLQIINELEKRIEHFEKKEKAADNPSTQVDHLRTLLEHKVEDMKILEDQNHKLKAQNEGLQDKLEQLKQKVAMIHDEVRLSKQQMASSLGNESAKAEWNEISTKAPGFGLVVPKVRQNMAENELSGEENSADQPARFGFSDTNMGSSFNRAMVRVRGDELQAGRSISDNESQASTLGDHKEQKMISTQPTPKPESSSLDRRLRGLEELVKVLERENLLLVRKFETSRREVATLNDQYDEMAKKLREAQLKKVEQESEVSTIKSVVEEKEKVISSLKAEITSLSKEKEVFLARLRQEEELGAGVSRDREWHEALHRLNTDMQKKDSGIGQLTEEISNLKYLIGKLQAENSHIPELENEVIVLRSKLDKADERVSTAERDAQMVKDQIKRLAKQQVRSEEEEWTSNEEARRQAEQRAVDFDDPRTS
jgi:chromosome segregation ATPase